jgi:hypothetical protein
MLARCWAAIDLGITAARLIGAGSNACAWSEAARPVSTAPREGSPGRPLDGPNWAITLSRGRAPDAEDDREQLLKSCAIPPVKTNCLHLPLFRSTPSAGRAWSYPNRRRKAAFDTGVRRISELVSALVVCS